MMTTRISQARRTDRRGFTLMELMVAMTGALSFVVFVLLLSKDVSRFFQEETRMSDTTLSMINGFERLRNDIGRSGFLTSPNLSRDVASCPRPTPGAAASRPQQVSLELNGYPGIQDTALARLLFPRNSSGGHYSLNPTIETDRLVLFGNYTSTDQFPVRATVQGTAFEILLEPTSAPLTRLGFPTGNATADVDLLKTVFRPDSAIRIVDQTGRQQFGIVDDVTVAGGVPTIELDSSLTVITKDSIYGQTCGMKVNGAGSVVNPVDIVRYELADTSTGFSQFKFLHQGSAPTYDTTRLDLIRMRLAPNLALNTAASNASVRDTVEVVAEYAADFRIGATVVSDLALGQLNFVGETEDAELEKYLGSPHASDAGDPGFGPHLIRGIHARLSVRNIEADREEAVVDDPGTTAADQLFRVQVATDQWARLRTLRSHVAMRNSKNALWE